MSKFLIIFFVIIFGFNIRPISTVAHGFCSLPCKLQGGLKNVVCERTHCGLDGRKCGPKGKEFKFRGNFIDCVLNVHNKLRNKIAKGEDTRGGNSAASNMMVLSYHQELAFTAQCLANYCIFDHKCGRTKSFSTVGQNLWTKWSSKGVGPLSEKLVEDAITNWYEEIVDGDKDLIDRFKTTKKKTGHFTQAIWAETKYVGCGASTYDNRMLIVCNYAPAGNMLTGKVYKRGTACSECPKGVQCNKKYPGLCGQINNKLDYKSPFGVGATISGKIYFILIILFILYVAQYMI